MATSQYSNQPAALAAGVFFSAEDELRAALESLTVIEVEAITQVLWFCEYCGEEDGSPVEVFDPGEYETGCPAGFIERCTVCAPGGRYGR